MSLARARVTVTLLGIRVAFFVVAQVVILPWLVTVLKVSAWLAGVGPSGGLFWCWWLLIVSVVVGIKVVAVGQQVLVVRQHSLLCRCLF